MKLGTSSPTCSLGGRQRGPSRRQSGNGRQSSTCFGGVSALDDADNRPVGGDMLAGQEDYGASDTMTSGGFGNGDLVWAKAFPYTWWPGLVRESKGGLRLVSLFGGDRSRWLEDFRVCGFEKNFERLSKMGGVRLAFQVDCALAELGRRTALAMACSCHDMAGKGDANLITQISRERERFEPVEVLGCVLCLAVFAWVHDGQTISTVRVAAQVNAYRYHVRATMRVEVSGRFLQEDTMDTSRDLDAPFCRRPNAESGSSTNYSTSEFSEGVMIADEIDSSDSSADDVSYEGTNLEMPLTSILETEETTDSGHVYENEREVQDNEDGWVQGKIHDVERCIINRIDFSMFSSDSESEHASDDEIENNHDRNRESAVALENSLNTCSDHSRYASFSHGLHGKDPLSPSVEVRQRDASTWYPPESTTESISKLYSDFPFEDQASLKAQKFHDEICFTQIIHEILHYLHCVACDPLQTRSTNLTSCLQLLLSYRTSTFQNISGFPSTIWTENAKEFLEHDTWECQHLENEKIEDHCHHENPGTYKHSGISGVLFHSPDDRMVLSSSAEHHVNLHSPHASGDSIISCSSAGINDFSKTEETNSAVGEEFQYNSEKRLSGRIISDTVYAFSNDGIAKVLSHFTSPVSHGSRRRFDQESMSATSNNLHATNSDLESKLVPMSNENKSFSVKGSESNDRVETSFLYALSGAAIRPNINFLPTASTSGNEKKRDIVTWSSAFPSCRYETSSRRERMHGRKIECDAPKWQNETSSRRERMHGRKIECDAPKWQNETLASLNRWYASPLERNLPSTAAMAQCSAVTRRMDGSSNSLLMKFPRGFNLPSEENLRKIFSVFGPLDHSRTRVFSYTHVGKVVFTNPIDAKTAYNYVRRNRLFETDMYFWLGASGKAREEHGCASSLSGDQMVRPSLKSCLKRFNIDQNGDVRKKHRVRFSI